MNAYTINSEAMLDVLAVAVVAPVGEILP